MNRLRNETDAEWNARKQETIVIDLVNSPKSELPASIIGTLESLIENYGFKAIANKLADIETANQVYKELESQEQLVG